jgi:PRTRC genetic system protein C
MARIFQYDGRQFPDPDPRLSVEDVRRSLGDFFPELANADTREERRGEDQVYTFTRRIGTKGAPRGRRSRVRTIVGIIRAVPAARLGVFPLAAALLDAGGELDLDAAAARGPEVHLAIAEAEAYARATRHAVAALRRLPPRHG